MYKIKSLVSFYFKTEDEDEFTKVILKFQKSGFPLTLSKVHSLAFQYAELNHIKGFSTKSKKAGCKWAKFYLKRYLEIRVKKPRTCLLPGPWQQMSRMCASGLTNIKRS